MFSSIIWCYYFFALAAGKLRDRVCTFLVLSSESVIKHTAFSLLLLFSIYLLLVFFVLIFLYLYFYCKLPQVLFGNSGTINKIN